MAARTFDFRVGGRNAWAQGHALRNPVVNLSLAFGPIMGTSVDLTARMTPAEARAMAAALEAAATFAENVLDTGLGESAVDTPAVSA